MKARIVIAGAGITGLATAAWLKYDHGITDVLVIDKAEHAGGKMRTEIIDGHTIEWGPQGFLDNAPDTLELVRLCGLDEALIRADEASADRFILREGKLRSVPTSPLKFMASDVLPLGAKLRLFGEPFARRRPPVDETVFDFAKRRIGVKAAEILVDAMVTGVFAGDSRLLSLAATFPKMAAMEAEHNSLTRALIAKIFEARKNKTKSAGPAGPGGTLCTFSQGMAQLPLRLADMLGDRLRLKTSIDRIDLGDTDITITSPDSSIDTKALLMATPAEATAAMLGQALPEVITPLEEIKTAPIAVVMTSYPDAHAFGVPLKGFGFLIPGSEKAGLLGALFCHTIFPGQAPTGSVFIRAMLGGARNPDAASLSDNDLVTRVRSLMAKVYGHDPEPSRTWIVRHEKGISQYTVGHLRRVEKIETAVRSKGIEVAGSPYRGVSVNDCIKQARATATRLAETR